MRLTSLFAKWGAAGAMYAAALVASACADGPGGLTGPSASVTGNQISALTASAPRSGDLAFHPVEHSTHRQGREIRLVQIRTADRHAMARTSLREKCSLLGLSR